MDKGKNTLVELTEEELQRKIERITREVKEAKEEGLRVDMATAIYKAAVATLDEDLASQMKRKKDAETETESLREKLDMLRLEVQEREAREARIGVENAVLLVKSALLDKELTVHSNLMDRKHPACEQRATNSGFDDAHLELVEEDDGEKIVYKPPFLGRLKGRE
ncbi:hypothetical protein EJD97_019420 [Solanum chilense]|uniref:Uncharacterized protein n=1 Tax=Solanum chilense TaxID=4083 RepID=A0A6N2AZ53_SOLCI|nr:hypothetical protein EJD97_019420 [Solanum chilense]